MGMVMDLVMNNKSIWQHPFSGFTIFLLSTTVVAQQNIPGATPGPGNGSGTSSTSAAQSPAQSSIEDASRGRTWSVKPRISATETFTDNVDINRTGNQKQNDFITELTPGMRIEARSAHIKAYLDYALRKQFYAKNAEYNRSQNSLNSFGTLEAVDSWLFLDFSATIAQQSISAFGTQSPSNTSINNNSTETATYRLSPYIRGQLGGAVEYSLRYNSSTTRSDAGTVSDIDLTQWTGQVSGGTPFQKLRWTIDGNQQTTDYSTGRKTDAETLRAILTYAIIPQLRFSLSGGQESNNYGSLDQEKHATHGYGFDWTPTERTKISAFKEKRFFGNGHKINFSHRFPRSSVQFSDIKDVSALPNQFATVGLGSLYDLYFEQFSSLIPDQVARASFVNALLAQNGIDPKAQVTSSFTTSQVTIRRNQLLSMALFGARNSITLQANRSESQSTLTSQSIIDAGTQSSLVKQQGISLNFSHRLSELSNINLLGSRQESTGNGSGATKTTTTLYQINLSTKLGAKTMGSLSARRSEFDGSTNPYTENALLATVSFIY